MRYKAELIVLNHTKFGENSIVLHTLSEEYGRKGFMVRAGVKNSMSMFLPMNILEAEISENPKSSLWRASDFVCLSPLNGIRSDIRKNTMTSFMSEVLYRTVVESTNEIGLFAWLKREILMLDALESDFSNFHLLFLLDFCTVLGFTPTLAGLAPFAGSQFSNIQNLWEKYNACHSGQLSVEALMMPLRGSDRNEIAEIIIRYISWHIEADISIRSLEVLRQVFK